jgi:hypothetical protein
MTASDTHDFSLAGAPGSEGNLGFGQPPAMQQIAHLKSQIVASVKAIIEPHLYDSGYRTNVEPGGTIFDARRPLRLWVPSRNDSDSTRQLFEIDGLLIDDIEGVTEYGVITDTHGGGLVTEAFEDLPVEDLLRLHIWARHTFAQVASEKRRAQRQADKIARSEAENHPNRKPRTS